MQFRLNMKNAEIGRGGAALANSPASYIQLGGRVLIALLFLVSGALKAANSAATVDYIGSVGLPFPVVSLFGAIAAELGGGLALVVGYRTRLVAAGLAGFSIVTALIFHNQLADPNQLNHFLKNIAVAGGLLYVMAAGAGSWSIDAQSTKAAAR